MTLAPILKNLVNLIGDVPESDFSRTIKSKCRCNFVNESYLLGTLRSARARTIS